MMLQQPHSGVPYSTLEAFRWLHGWLILKINPPNLLWGASSWACSRIAMWLNLERDLGTYPSWGLGMFRGMFLGSACLPAFWRKLPSVHKTLNWKPRKASPIHSLFPFPKVPASSFKVNLQTQAGSILSEYHKEVPAPSSHFRKFTWMNTNETANKRIKCYRNFYVFYHFNAFRSKRPEPLQAMLDLLTSKWERFPLNSKPGLTVMVNPDMRRRPDGSSEPDRIDRIFGQ